MSYIPLLVLVLILIGIVVYNNRNRQRQAAEDARMRREITVGTDVMTTSGLYGTVTEVYEDDTVSMLISPGVEVRWAFAALRDAQGLPDRYRSPGADGAARPGDDGPTRPGGDGPATTG